LRTPRLGVLDLGPAGIGRDNQPTLVIDPARDRGELGSTVGTGGGHQHLVAGSDEVEQVVEAD